MQWIASSQRLPHGSVLIFADGECHVAELVGDGLLPLGHLLHLLGHGLLAELHGGDLAGLVHQVPLLLG